MSPRLPARSATPYPCVEVDWVDSQSETRWRPLREALAEADADDLVHHSSGYLVADTPRYVVIAGSYRHERPDDRGEMAADLMQIPRSAVLDVRELAEAGEAAASSALART